MSRLSKKTALALVAMPAWLALLLLAGCDQDQYPEDLTYPLRTDPLIQDTPTDPQAMPQHFDTPGEFPQTWLTILVDKGAKVVDPRGKKRTDKQLQELDQAVSKTFGTPAHPRIGDVQKTLLDDWLGDIDNNFKIKDKEAAKDRTTADVNTFFEQEREPLLAQGSLLYRRHCLQCHGLTGDGRGHTAPWINPHPRDFRRGMFKFTSSGQEQGSGRKARREDLLRTLHQGIEGTAMPSFGLLADQDLEALAGYVIHLSLRGEAESHAMFDDLEAGQSMEDAVQESLQTNIKRWIQTEENVIVAPAYPSTATNDQQTEDLRQASVLRGEHFFMANCLSCHENYGRKDVYKYDIWGTIVRPMNLTLGAYRGGRRPIDLYWRIHAGINGANMPATVPSAMKPEEVWDVVNFVQALPYQAMLPAEVREKIYGPQ